MNIFFTNINHSICAKDHCTFHTRKMIVEYCQLLSTAHHVLDGDNTTQGIYKKTHVNHPSAILVRQSLDHYLWLWNTAYHLCRVYNQTAGKTHASEGMLTLTLCFAPQNIGRNLFIEPPKCMPDQFKLDSVEDSYKLYLNHKYQDLINRQKPIKVEWYGDKPSWVTAV